MLHFFRRYMLQPDSFLHQEVLNSLPHTLHIQKYTVCTQAAIHIQRLQSATADQQHKCIHIDPKLEAHRQNIDVVHGEAEIPKTAAKATADDANGAWKRPRQYMATR